MSGKSNKQARGPEMMRYDDALHLLYGGLTSPHKCDILGTETAKGTGVVTVHRFDTKAALRQWQFCQWPPGVQYREATAFAPVQEENAP